jgi:hypothetical protein
MNILDKLKAGTHNVKTTNWPGAKEQLGFRVLTEQEIQDAHFATEGLFKKQGIEFSASTVDAYQSEQNTQVLARAIVDVSGPPSPGPRPSLFASADELRGLIGHPDIKAALIDEYNSWQTECSPLLGDMTQDKYDALFESVKKNGPSTLNGLSSKTLSGLITYLADRQTKLQQVSGSISA